MFLYNIYLCDEYDNRLFVKKIIYGVYSFSINFKRQNREVLHLARIAIVCEDLVSEHLGAT